MLLYTYNDYYLRWCRDCTELHLELFQSGMARQDCPWEHLESTSNVIDLSRKKLYDQMKWMVSLKGISVWSRLADRCLDDFCHWLLLELKPPALEKMWLPPVKALSLPSFKPGSILTSLYLARLDAQSCSALFPQLTHLAGISIPSESKLPRLRFLRGNFPSILASQFIITRAFWPKGVLVFPLQEIKTSTFLLFRPWTNFANNILNWSICI